MISLASLHSDPIWIVQTSTVYKMYRILILKMNICLSGNFMYIYFVTDKKKSKKSVKPDFAVSQHYRDKIDTSIRFKQSYTVRNFTNIK